MQIEFDLEGIVALKLQITMSELTSTQYIHTYTAHIHQKVLNKETRYSVFTVPYFLDLVPGALINSESFRFLD